MADYDLSRYTPLDNTLEMRDILKSGYKNMRFVVTPASQIQITAATMCNLPGLAYQLYGDTSLWRALLDFNGLSDPISDVCVGMTLLVPSKASLIDYLSKPQANQNPTLTI